ncbi:hypothetical protein AOLI_G00244480 [Acnodon oligacanthus]
MDYRRCDGRARVRHIELTFRGRMTRENRDNNPHWQSGFTASLVLPKERLSSLAPNPQAAGQDVFSIQLLLQGRSIPKLGTLDLIETGSGDTEGPYSGDCDDEDGCWGSGSGPGGRRTAIGTTKPYISLTGVLDRSVAKTHSIWSTSLPSLSFTSEIWRVSTVDQHPVTTTPRLWQRHQSTLKGRCAAFYMQLMMRFDWFYGFISSCSQSLHL